VAVAPLSVHPPTANTFPLGEQNGREQAPSHVHAAGGRPGAGRGAIQLCRGGTRGPAVDGFATGNQDLPAGEQDSHVVGARSRHVPRRRPGTRARIVDLCTSGDATIPAACRQHFPVGQQGLRISSAYLAHAAGDRPRPAGGVVTLPN
jgi:hypothetical protein